MESVEKICNPVKFVAALAAGNNGRIAAATLIASLKASFIDPPNVFAALCLRVCSGSLTSARSVSKTAQ